jgi:hypothetical protein
MTGRQLPKIQRTATKNSIFVEAGIQLNEYLIHLTYLNSIANKGIFFIEEDRQFNIYDLRIQFCGNSEFNTKHPPTD